MGAFVYIGCCFLAVIIVVLICIATHIAKRINREKRDFCDIFDEEYEKMEKDNGDTEL